MVAYRDIPPLQVALSTRARDAVIVQVRGEVDVYTAPLLRDRVEEAFDSGSPRVIIDLTAVGFLDSHGLSALVCAHKQAAARDVELRVVATTAGVIDPLGLTGLDAMLEMCCSVEEALRPLIGTAPH
ncbi:MAG: STAS domain-containing protein [Sciscionella sp.]